MAKKAEFIFVGDAKSVIRAAKQAQGAVTQTAAVTARAGTRMEASQAKQAASAARTGAALKRMALGAGAVGAVGIGVAVKTAIGFEKQLSSLGAVADATGKQMGDLRKQALKAGADTAFSAKEAAVAQTELAKGGVSAAEILKGGLNAALGLAAAGELELANAASITSNAMNLFGIKGEKAGHVADALAMAANATTADVADFGAALAQSGSVAKSAGLSFDETVVALEALASSGIKGSDAGTSLKTALIQLIKPTDKQSNMAKSLGLSFTTAGGKMKSLGAMSAMMRDKLGHMTAAQRTATLATLAGTDGVRTLTSLYDAGPAKLAKYADGVAKQGTAADVAAKKQKNLAGQIEQFKGSLETLGIIVGSAVIPPLTKVAKVATTFINQLSTGEGAGGKFRDAVMGIVNPVKNLVSGFQKGKVWAVALVAAMAGLGAAAVTIKVITTATRLWAAAQLALSLAMSANPISIVIVAVAALAAALVVVYKKSATFRTVVSAAFSVVRKVAAGAFDVITFGMRQFLTGIGKVAGAASKLPGMGWLKGVSKAALGAAGELKQISDRIRGVPKEKTFMLHVNMSAADEKKLRDFNKLPSRGGPRGTGRAAGGLIPGVGNEDTEAALLTPGEFVVRKAIVQKYGPTFFANLNSGKGPQQFNRGGIVAKANAIDARAYPYVWGGGHSRTGVPDGGTGRDKGIGYDCSGAVSAIFGISPPRTSGNLMSWGLPGPGSPNDSKIYTDPGHVFAVINGRGWGTSGENPGGGAGWLSYNTPRKSGMTARHINDSGTSGKAGSKGQPSREGSGGGASAASAASDKRAARASRSGSRAINRILAKTGKGLSTATASAKAIGGAIDDADTGYGRTERAYGQVLGGVPGAFGDENLGTATGRTQRTTELQELRRLKVAQQTRMKRRAAALAKAIGKLTRVIKEARKQRGRAKGAKRAKMTERIKSLDDKLIDLKAEAGALDRSFPDLALDISDLDRELHDVANTADDAAEAGPTTMDKVSAALSHIDALERAGDLSATDAQAARVGTINHALANGFGAISDEERLGLRGDLRAAMEAAAEATTANTQALIENTASNAALLAYADGVSAVTSVQAVRAMSDVITGNLGYRTGNRALMPGSGALSRL